MRLYTDEKVRFGADITGGLRVSHLSHIEEFTIALQLSRGNIKSVTIKVLEVKQVVETQKSDTETAI